MVPPKSFPSAGSAFDAAQIALAVLDTRGKITGWSRAAERLTGYPYEMVLHRPGARLLDNAQDLVALRAVIENPRAEDTGGMLVAVRHRDGRRLRLALRILPFQDPDRGRAWMVLAQDEQQRPGPHLSQMMLEPLLCHSPIGVAVLDKDLRYVWANDVLTYGGVLPLEKRLGRRLTEILPTEASQHEEAQFRQVLETGVPILDFEFLATTPADPSRQHAWWESIFRLEDSAGQVRGVWFMALDTTERWRAQERLALLTDASAHIGSTLDVVRTAQELAEVAVPRFADIVTVDLLEAVLSGEETPPELVGASPEVHRAGQKSVHDEWPGTTVRIGDTLRCRPGSPSARCLKDGALVRESLTDPSVSAWATENPARADAVLALGIHSVLVVPVQARGVSLGLATFLRSRCPDPFDEEDVSLAEELIARAAVCLDNARRFTRERNASLALQHSLLPRGLLAGSTLEVASRYLPAKAPHTVGGDWFDAIPLSGARVALVVGDVVGQGLHAAATMGRLRAAVRTLAALDMPPDELLAHLDDLVISLAEQEDADRVAEGREQAATGSVLGATCLYAVYDRVTRRCTLARAGHIHPAVVGADGTVDFPELPAGPPLGLGCLPFESTELELSDGAVLALFTDGLVEDRQRDAEDGLAVLTRGLARPAPALEDMCENVISALVATPPQDDAALLVARVRGLSAEQVASYDLANDPAVVASARDFATRQLAQWSLEELQFTTELIVSELVTNAIRYGAEPIRLRLIREDGLICEVCDGSSTSPRLRHARTTDEGGRGLFLVAQLARRWGTRYTATGKIIWAEQPVPSMAGG